LRLRRFTLWTLIALVAVSVLFLVRELPPWPEAINASAWTAIAARTVPGGYHIHTTRSDGHGDKHDVAAAAARAGLKFVIITDHGDATRPPDPPEYIDGVLCLDAVEISTDQGHLVALDLPRAPYPLGGPAYSVVEDVQRLGGFAIAAHPDSPKPALRWTDGAVPLDGIEWLNIDSEWRKDARGRLIRAGLAYFFRPGPALATLLDRPGTLGRWDRLTDRRGGPWRVIGLAGSDAHGGVGRRAEDTGRSLAGTIGIPSYEASFRALSNRVIVDAPFSGDAARDGREVYDAIRKGSVFSTIDALAGPGLLDLHVEGTTVIAHATRPRGAELALMHDGLLVAYSSVDLHYDASDKPGAYRVEVRLPTAPGDLPIPWLVSNFVYVGPEPGTPGTAPPAADTEPRTPSTAAAFPWRIEKDPVSSAILRTAVGSAELEYRLADGPRNSQFVALATDIQSQAFGGIRLGLKSDRPSRVWVQVRTSDGRRWGRSYYVDPSGSEIDARLNTFRPIGDDNLARVPDPKSLTSILLVVDLTNAAPGHAGRLAVLHSELVN
jgi:hypothetical protein